jgi:hypothetical protein
VYSILEFVLGQTAPKRDPPQPPPTHYKAAAVVDAKVDEKVDVKLDAKVALVGYAQKENSQAKT